MTLNNAQTEKITVTITNELKRHLVALKDELQISMSSIYKEALESYIEKKEIERWEKGAILASKNKEYMSHSQTIGNEGIELHEY